MRRVFTRLKSGWQTAPFIHWRKAFFLEDPDCPTLVVKATRRRTKSVRPPERRKRRFVLVYILRYVYYVTYITLRLPLRFVNFRKEKYILLFVNFR